MQRAHGDVLWLVSDSGMTKAGRFPNFKTNAKSRNKTHTQCSRMRIRFHHLGSLQLSVRTKALVLNYVAPSSCCLPKVSWCLFPWVTNGQMNPTDSHVEGHDRTWLCGRHVCDLSTHRYWHSPPGKGFCNISFSKTRRNLLSWRVWLGRTTKAICKGAFCCSKEGWRQSCEMLRSICIWMKGSAIIYSFDKTCIHWCLKFSCFFFPGSHGKRKQIIYRNNYFIECIYTVKPQLLNHSWAR